jgi:Ricin-type beta-trefoil lectin domain
MPKTIYVFLLCSVLAMPILGASNAQAVNFVNFDGACLTDAFADTHDGNPIVALQCLGVPSQEWQFQGTEILGLGTSDGVRKCLTNGGPAAGSPVQLSQCNGSANQLWNFFNGRIRSLLGNLCVDVGDGSALTPAKLQPCTSIIASTGQRWGIVRSEIVNRPLA